MMGGDGERKRGKKKEKELGYFSSRDVYIFNLDEFQYPIVESKWKFCFSIIPFLTVSIIVKL